MGILFFIFIHDLPCLALDLDKMRDRKNSLSAALNPAPKSEAERHTFYLGFSLYSKYINKTTSQGSGTADLFSPVQYPLNFIYSYRFTDSFRILPELDYTVFYKKGEDGGTEESDLLVHLPLVKSSKSGNYEWKVGLIFHQFKIHGHGGTVTLMDSGSNTDFALPEYDRTVNTFKPEFGMIYEMKSLQFQASVILENPFNSSKRNYSILTGLSYKLGNL